MYEEIVKFYLIVIKKLNTERGKIMRRSGYVRLKSWFSIELLIISILVFTPKTDAASFKFSFSNSSNETVTGTIFGLVDNGVSQQASHVVLDSVTNWTNLGLGEGVDTMQGSAPRAAQQNTWTVVGGIVTSFHYGATTDLNGSSIDDLYMVGAITQGGSYTGQREFQRYGPGRRHLQGDGEFTITASPVPEPTTFLLLGIGIVGLAGADVRRRRKKKAIASS